MVLIPRLSGVVRRGAVFAAAGSAVVATASPASAGTHVVYDPRGDAPARADIVKVVVTKGPTVVTAKVKVRKLRRGNSIGVDYSYQGSDSHTQALVHRTASGRLVSRLVYYRESSFALSCSQTARWRKVKRLVVITTPLSCFDEFGFGDRAAGVAYRTVPATEDIFYPEVVATDRTRYFKIS